MRFLLVAAVCVFAGYVCAIAYASYRTVTHLPDDTPWE